MQANLTYDQRKTLLTGLGYEIKWTSKTTYPQPYNMEPHGRCYVLRLDGSEIVRDRFYSSERAAYESIPLDMNLCFEVVVPGMREKGFLLEWWSHGAGECYARFSRIADPNEMYIGDEQTDSPATAICLAALQFMEGEK